MSFTKNGENGHNGHLEEINWRKSEADFETLVVTGSCAPQRFASKCLVPPIVNSVSYLVPGVEGVKYKSDNEEGGGAKNKFYEYGRYANPTRDALEECFATLEGSKYGLAFSSGSAAISSVLYSVLKSGDHIVSMKALYGGSYRAFLEVSKFGISADFSDTGYPHDIMSLVKENTKLIWLESPCNPTLLLADIGEISRLAHARNPEIIVAVDNTFMTPLRQRPLELGADVCIYSASKYLGGHGDIIIIKTLALRMDQHEKSALKIAHFLENHSRVERVIHPGLKSHPQHELAKCQQFGHSGMVGIYVKGGLDGATKFLSKIKLVLRAASLGSDFSLASIPGKMSQAFIPEKERLLLDITDNYIRLSVGLENSQALIEDLDQALNQSF